MVKGEWLKVNDNCSATSAFSKL